MTATSPALAEDRAVVGDGTSAAGRARARLRRARWPLGTVLVVVVVGALTALLPARTSAVPLAPDNPGSGGARALAQILQEQGVRIDYVRTVNQATAQAVAGSTLLVAGTTALWGDQIDTLADTPADLVVLGPNSYDIAQWSGGAMEMSRTGRPAQPTARPASCADPDAAAAELITSAAPTLVSTGDAVVCFPDSADSAAGVYGVHTVGDRRLVLMTDTAVMTNDALAEDGNAALMLRALGHHERLVWLVPSWDDSGLDTPVEVGLADRLPGWANVLALQLLVVVLAVAVWRGRRMGPLVTEPLPVTVRAAETTVGRGRLYRRSRAWGHAAAALRAGTARRTAARLGLPRSAGARDVIDALARATTRTTEQITYLLYGPPPTDDAGLTELARALDELESEVHRT